jgi:predicted small lipoprotein YifL
MNATLHLLGISARSLRCLIVATVLCSAAACGLKGPLYMPDQKPDMVEVKVPPGVPVPTTQKKDRTENSKQPSGSTQPTPTPPER